MPFEGKLALPFQKPRCNAMLRLEPYLLRSKPCKRLKLSLQPHSLDLLQPKSARGMQKQLLLMRNVQLRCTRLRGSQLSIDARHLQGLSARRLRLPAGIAVCLAMTALLTKT